MPARSRRSGSAGGGWCRRSLFRSCWRAPGKSPAAEPPEMETPPGQGRAEGTPNATNSSAWPCAPEALRRDARFRHLVHRLHQLGPRPAGELLLELADAYGIESDILARLEKLAELD